jgi:hypothetical protein
MSTALPGQKKITVTVSPKGAVTIEGSGFSGASCLTATRPLEQALGLNTAAERELKTEYHETSVGFAVEGE